MPCLADVVLSQGRNVNSVCVISTSLAMQIVSVGRDGGISTAGLSSMEKSGVFRTPRQAASYNAVKWASLKTFVTSGPTGKAIYLRLKRQPK